MGLFDFLSSTKRPAAGVPVLAAAALRERLLAANRPGAPFHIIDGAADGCDLIAEWRIVDAAWFEIFAKAGLSKSFKVQLRLDEATHELRALDRELTVEWRAGVPTVAFAVSAFRGQKQSVEFGRAYGFTEKGSLGEIYNYYFETKELKTPLQKAATDCGWTYKGVSFGKL